MAATRNGTITACHRFNIEVPDDARDLDRDVQAYHRELRALRWRRRTRWLVVPLGRDGMVLPLLAGCLALTLLAGTLLTVRPSIVETSTDQPFRGWNEGINTSAPLSYLLGTYFRQLPTNERKCLDVIPVDMVCRGMTLIAAAILERRHEPIYQLSTSASNPCDMGRSIELTGLAHRKHYRSQQSLENWMRMQF